LFFILSSVIIFCIIYYIIILFNVYFAAYIFIHFIFLILDPNPLTYLNLCPYKVRVIIVLLL